MYSEVQLLGPVVVLFQFTAVFSFLGHLHSVFLVSINIHSHQPSTKIHLPLYPHQHLLLFLYNSHPNRFKMIFNLHLDLHVFMLTDVECLLPGDLVLLIINSLIYSWGVSGEVSQSGQNSTFLSWHNKFPCQSFLIQGLPFLHFCL